MKLYKLKPNTLPLLKAWGDKLQTDLRKEALMTLVEENCARERVFYFTLEDVDYALAEMEPMEGKTLLPSSEREINKAHKTLLTSCIDTEVPVRLVYDLLS